MLSRNYACVHQSPQTVCRETGKYFYKTGSAYLLSVFWQSSHNNKHRNLVTKKGEKKKRFEKWLWIHMLEMWWLWLALLFCNVSHWIAFIIWTCVIFVRILWCFWAKLQTLKLSFFTLSLSCSLLLLLFHAVTLPLYSISLLCTLFLRLNLSCSLAVFLSVSSLK